MSSASTFHDFACIPSASGPTTSSSPSTVVSFSPSHPPVLAVGTSGLVSFYLDEATPAASTIHGNGNPTNIKWASATEVVVTWSTGKVELWSYTAAACVCKSATTSAHSSSVNFLEIAPQGSRCVTGDESGSCCVWKLGSTLLPHLQYSRPSALTCVCYAASSFPPSFFFGTASGTVAYADDAGHCTDVQNLGTQVDTLTFYADKGRLVIITRSLLMTQLAVAPDGRVTPVMKVKLSIAGTASSAGVTNTAWIGPGALAAAAGESMLRVWDLRRDSNYVLPIKPFGVQSSSRVTCVAFNPTQRYVAAGTNNGEVCMWSWSPFSVDPDDESATEAAKWRPLPLSRAKSSVTSVTFAPGQGALAVSSETGAVMLCETVLRRAMGEGVAGMQSNNDTVVVETPTHRMIVNADVKIKGMAIDDTHLVVYNGKDCQVYEGFGESGDGLQHVTSSFVSSAKSVCIRKDTLFLAQDNRMLVTNLQGVHRAVVNFTEAEGQPALLSLNGNYLAVATDANFLKLFDVSRKEPKPLGSSGRFVDPQTNQEIGAIRSIAINSDGTRLAILSDKVEGSLGIRTADTKLYVYDGDSDIVKSFDFRTRAPTAVFWDSKEAKLLACETRLVGGNYDDDFPSSKNSSSPLKSMWNADSKGKSTISSKGSGSGSMTRSLRTPKNTMSEEDIMSAEAKDGESSSSRSPSTALRVEDSNIINSTQPVEVSTMFVSSDFGIRVQDVVPVERPIEGLIGINVPRLYFAQQQEDDPDAKSTGVALPSLASTMMRDFVGLTDVDNTTRNALLDFSFYLTIGDMDKAYSAVKLVRNAAVWENMAHMCVKTKRLDVAEVCLGNMGHARGAAAVREAKKEPEVEAAIAAVAIQLGLLEDAAKLYKECGRYDLLNKMYQAQGKWNLALEIADSNDRIHLKTTHHQYGKYLESIGDTSGAIRNFERADSYKNEVPRMLFDQGRMEDLEDYIMQGNDQELLKWWAAHEESQGRYERARRFYQRAGDDLSLVRIACHNREMQEAEDIVNESKNKSAAYHLARQLEAIGEVQQAITYFSMAGTVSHAIRLAMAYGLSSELMAYSLRARPSTMISVARYFEERGEHDRACQLYEKAGDHSRALSLAMKAGNDGDGHNSMFDVLQTLAENLGENASEKEIRECVDYFVNRKAVGRAVELLYKQAKRYDEAIDLCVEHKVTIDDKMAEGMTPPKSDDPAEQDRRVDTLTKLARALKKQNSWQLACKIFTLAGDRLRAMKCLIRSGETDQIVFYAKSARNKDLYVLAANYLQSLDWNSKPDIMNQIITFYTKAKAFEQLASFYEACSAEEIDSFRDYAKALSALREAAKYAGKSTTPAGTTMAANIQQKIGVVQRFVEARELMKSDPAEAEDACLDLIGRGPRVEDAIRVGDVYALLIEDYERANRMEDAWSLIRQMQDKGLAVGPFVEADLLKSICDAVGQPVPGARRPDLEDSGEGDEIDDEIGEELDESIGEDMGSDDDDHGYGHK